VPLEYVTVKRSKRASSGVGAARYSRTTSAHNNAVARLCCDVRRQRPRPPRPEPSRVPASTACKPERLPSTVLLTKVIKSNRPTAL
jgi:hypothetical protein